MKLNAKSLFLMCLIISGFFFASCGGKSDLVGRWYKIEGSGSSIPREIELLKDGTGFALDQAITWKTENKRLYITHPLTAMTFDYKLTGSMIELANNKGEKFAYVKKFGGVSAIIGTWELDLLNGESLPEGAKVTIIYHKDGTGETIRFENGEKATETKWKWVGKNDLLYTLADNGRINKDTFETKGKTLKLKNDNRTIEYKKK